MDTLDPAAEWRNLSERYSQLSDEEVQTLAGEAYELTEVARQVLRETLRSRQIPVELAEASPMPEDLNPSNSIFQNEEEPGEFDPTELELDSVWTVWDPAEAKTATTILGDAGVPCYFGPDNDERVEDVQRSFDRGVEIKVRHLDLQRALLVLQHEMPKSADDAVVIPDVDVRCPRCDSDAIVFEQLQKVSPDDPDIDAKFNWRCDACGHKWQDDGVDR